jgi:hypothetical protein
VQPEFALPSIFIFEKSVTFFSKKKTIEKWKKKKKDHEVTYMVSSAGIITTTSIRTLNCRFE